MTTDVLDRLEALRTRVGNWVEPSVFDKQIAPLFDAILSYERKRREEADRIRGMEGATPDARDALLSKAREALDEVRVVLYGTGFREDESNGIIRTVNASIAAIDAWKERKA